MILFLVLAVNIPVTNAVIYYCDNTVTCNKEFIFNEPQPNTEFRCTVSGACNDLVIYYAGSSLLEVSCSGPNACDGTKVYCGNWSPQITNINNDITCFINCVSPTRVACKNVFFSCKSESGQVNECFMGSDGASRNIEASTMECNIGSNNCEWSCFNSGCCNFDGQTCSGYNELLCYTGSICYCGEGNCGGVEPFSDVTYEPTAPPTAAPITSSPTIIPTTATSTTFSPTTTIPTTTSPTTFSPTTAIPTIFPTTLLPTTRTPTDNPTNTPTLMPSVSPTHPPTNTATTDSPTSNKPTTSIPTTSEPTTNEPTTPEPTFSDGNVGDGDGDISTTMDDSSVAGDNQQRNAGNGGILGMNNKIMFIVVGGLIIVCLICIIILFACFIKMKKTELVKAHSTNMSVMSSTEDNIDNIQMPITPFGIEMTGTGMAAQSQININTMVINDNENEESISKSQDSINAMYLESNSVVTPRENNAMMSYVDTAGNDEFDEMYKKNKNEHTTGGFM